MVTPGARSARLTSRGAAYLAAILVAGVALGRVLSSGVASLSLQTVALVPLACLFIAFAAWLSIRRPLAAFVLGFALLGIVRIEPAPVDAVFALLIAASFVTEAPRPRVPPFIALPLAALVALTIVSATNAIDLHAAVKFGATTFYMLGLAVWLSWAFGRESWAHLAMKTYIIVAVICGALGPIFLYLHLPARSLYIYSDARAEGLFKDPNVYSAFLVPAAVILLEELSNRQLLRWRRSVIIAAFALVTMGVVVAFSRAAWLDFALAAVTLVGVQVTRRRGIRLASRSIFVLVISGCLGFLLLFLTGSIGFLRERSHLQSYDSNRFSTQSSAFGDATRHVFGYGPGQTEVRLPLATHSSFARVAFEQGGLGLAALILIFGGTLLCAVLLARRRRYVQGVGTAALLGIWIGQVANSFFIDTIHWRHLWIFAGLIWCGYAMPRDSGPRVARHP